jgi:hypothetical protein
MFRQYRTLERGEFIVVFGDCSQGGADSNFHQYGSQTYRDIPIVFQMQGVAAEATSFLRDGLNWVYDQTGVKPVVCLERNNGGASEMYNLIKFNEGKYTVYYMRDETGKPTDKPGWDTTGGVNGTGTRPKMLGEWLLAYEGNMVTVYDEVTQDQHQTFVVNNRGKPEASAGNHDDGVMSCAGVWQLMQTEHPPIVRSERRREPRKKLKLHVGSR